MSWLWQDMRAMYPKSPANRRWRIHHVNILPGRGPFRCTSPSNHARRADLATINVRKALRTEVKRSWVSQAHFALRPTAPPHDRARLRQPCAITAAAALWPVAQTHGSQCCGERAVQRCICTSRPAASARPQQPSPPALLGGRAPNDSRMSPWRILLHGSCPHFFGRRRPSAQHKKRPAFAGRFCEVVS